MINNRKNHFKVGKYIIRYFKVYDNTLYQFKIINYTTHVFQTEMFQEESQWPFISYIIQYAFVLIMLLTNCFADEAPSYSEYLPVEVS